MVLVTEIPVHPSKHCENSPASAETCYKISEHIVHRFRVSVSVPCLQAVLGPMHSSTML